MNEVIPGMLWTAGLREAEDLVSPEAMGAYAQHRIAAVLTVAHDIRPRCVAVLPQLCLPVREDCRTSGLLFDMACSFARLYGALLVHCNGGRNRSRVFAAAIAHKVFLMPIDQAIAAAGPPPGPCFDSFIHWARGRQ
jgi:hypothetical protein